VPKTTLRKVGGSIMMAVPPAILEILDMKAGTTVALAVEGERLVVEPPSRRRYTLKELLSQCDARAPRSKEDRKWLNSSRAGRELL
jgi:antitoxin ChpS